MRRAWLGGHDDPPLSGRTGLTRPRFVPLILAKSEVQAFFAMAFYTYLLASVRNGTL